MSLTLLAMGALGGLSAIDKFSRGKSQQADEDRQRRFYESEISQANKFKSELVGEQKSSGTDLFTNYITTRDNQKAAGIANMYLQRYTDFKNSIRNTDMQIGALRGEMANVKRTSNADIHGDVLGDVASTAVNMIGAHGAEQAAARTAHNEEQMMQMIQKPTHEYVPFKEQGFFDSMFSAFKSKDDYVSKFGNAPTTMPEILDIPAKSNRSSYGGSNSLTNDMSKFRAGMIGQNTLSKKFITGGAKPNDGIMRNTFDNQFTNYKKLTTNSNWDNYFDWRM